MHRNRLLLGAFLSVLLVFSLITSVTAEASMWVQNYGRADWDATYSLVETSDGGYALAGYTINYSVGTRDFWLVKTDENGIAPVAPEAAWVILPLLAAATVSIFISKKKLLNNRS